jgi:hypothetical protein
VSRAALGLLHPQTKSGKKADRAIARIRPVMSQSTTPISAEMRERVVRKLTVMVGVSVTAQAVIFLALSWVYRLIVEFGLETTARAGGEKNAGPADAIALILLVALELFTALAVSFIASRRLLRSILRATPHPMKPPTRPIPWASLSAAIAIAVILALMHAAGQDLSPALGWTFEIVRDAAIVALFWIGSVRAVGPKVA